MEEKLHKLYEECIRDFEKIGIKLIDNPDVGEINICLAKRKCKRYGCCKQENPCKSSKYIEYRGRKRYIKYAKFEKHNIEISKWVMELNDEIIKDTIAHELIHCLPNCDNHGATFKKYAHLMNSKLGYNITTLGNKAADYKKSNLEYKENENQYNYEINCIKCGQKFYRKRLNKNLIRRYRCAKCGGKFEVNEVKK